MTEFHRILNVSRTASLQDIKKAYRELALKYHPDLNPVERRKEVEQQFVKITEAYNHLSELKSRESNENYHQNYNIRRQQARRNPIHDQRSKPYTGEHFNTKVWNAWHYGQDTIWVDAVQFRNSFATNSIESKHQAYFTKIRRRAAKEKDTKENIRENLDRMRSDRIHNIKRRKENQCTIM